MVLNQQTKDDFLTSKFLSEEFTVNRDLVKSDLVIPVTSVRSVLGLSEPLVSPAYVYTSDDCIFSSKDNVITVVAFANYLELLKDPNNYTFYKVNMKKFSSLYETENKRVIEELHKLEHLCVPNFTALVNFIESSCLLVGLSFESMVNKESSIFDLLELRRDSLHGSH